MKCRTTVAMAAASCLWTVVPSAGAQTVKDLVGTWYLVSDTNTASDGHTVQPFGLTPQGIAIFDSNGHFAIVNARSDLPQFASNNRMHGTADENKAIVQGSLAFFGTYSVSDGVITQHIEGGTWPSQNGTDQKRTIIFFAGDEQTWTTAATLGGKSVLHWKRLK